jgi:hypothetical protein
MDDTDYFSAVTTKLSSCAQTGSGLAAAKAERERAAQIRLELQAIREASHPFVLLGFSRSNGI